MRYSVLDSIVLTRDLPGEELRAGDLGAVVEVYKPDSLEVEFVAASGHTRTLVTLTSTDVRPIKATDLVTMQSVAKTA